MLGIRQATDADGAAVTALIHGVLREYGLEPDAQGVDADLATLEASYVVPGGWFELLLEDGELRGTVGVVPVPDAPEATCELRKMYLQPAARGRGLGKALLDRSIGRARAAGFVRMRLETASVLGEAIALYRSVGFEELPEHPDVPRCDRTFELLLDAYRAPGALELEELEA